jgi:NAD(P)-dependent dehydrogenase (short-subunit alcohol dehydrogenase family)
VTDASYHASKHAVIGLTRRAAMEYAPRGTRINTVRPGGDRGLLDAGRLGVPLPQGTIDTPMITAMIANGDFDEAGPIAEQPIGRPGRAEDIAAWIDSDPPHHSFARSSTLHS